MNKLSIIALTILLVFSAGQINSAIAVETKEVTSEFDWKDFGKNLEMALLSENEGLQQSAMRFVIRYGDKINVGQGTLEILRTYRSDSDLPTRRLALTALPNTGSAIVMGFLKRAARFEKSPVLKRQIEFILAENEKK